MDIGKLVDFHNKYGHCIPIKGWHEEFDETMSVINEILNKSNKGTLPEVPPECEDLLHGSDFHWTIKGRHWQKWIKKFQLLVEYKKKNGHCNVSQLDKKNGLGPWLSAQRVLHKQSDLIYGRELLLNEIGVEWVPFERFNNKWLSQLDKLKQLKNENGACDVPSDDKSNLRTWVSAQRTAYRKGTLSKERIKLLNKVKFKWRARGNKET